MNRSERAGLSVNSRKETFLLGFKDGPINLKPQRSVVRHAGPAASLARIVPMPRGIGTTFFVKSIDTRNAQLQLADAEKFETVTDPLAPLL